jgi:hypothetical protein
MPVAEKIAKLRYIYPSNIENGSHTAKITKITKIKTIYKKGKQYIFRKNLGKN